jgi:hypothetical protein
MDFEGAGGAFITASAVAAVSLVFGAVFYRLLHSWIVDQTSSCAEGLALVGFLLLVMWATIALWGNGAMVLPGLAALVMVRLWCRHVARYEKAGEAEHWVAQEAKGRALLARDPGAVVGYEQLATALERQGRDFEAIEVAAEWLRRCPHDRAARDRLVRLRGLSPTDLPPPPPPPEEPKAPARDLGGVDLNELLAKPAAAPRREVSEEELLAAFAPAEPEAPDQRPDFENFGVAPEERPLPGPKPAGKDDAA